MNSSNTTTGGYVGSEMQRSLKNGSTVVHGGSAVVQYRTRLNNFERKAMNNIEQS